MNFPQQQPQGFYQPPQQPPQGYAPAPQGYAPPAAMTPGVAPGQAAAANLFNQFLTAPPRARINRARPADGMNVVRFTPGCKVDYSGKDGQAYTLIEYQVVESTVPQNVQGIFGYPMKLVTRNNIESLAELAKALLGAGGIQQLQQRGINTPQAMAEVIVGTLKVGNWFGYIQTRRSQKQIQAVGYEQAFVNNDFLFFAQQPFTLAQAQAHMTQMQPQAAAPQAPAAPQPQQWQQPQQGAPAQPWQQPQQGAPAQPWQQPAQQPPMQAQWPAAAPQQQQWQQPSAPPPQPVQQQPWQAQPPAQMPAPAAFPQQAPPPMHIPQQPPAPAFPAPPAFPQR